MELGRSTTRCRQVSTSSRTAGRRSIGLYGLTGKDVTVGGVQEVELFATNATIGDTDQTYLYGLTDVLGDLTRASRRELRRA